MFDLSLVQPLGGFSGDDKGARRHSSSLLLPHLLPQVLFKAQNISTVFEIPEVVPHLLPQIPFKAQKPQIKLTGTGAVRALLEASGERTTPSSPA